MDNLAFEKIYIDDYFYQLRIIANNDRITMSANVYTQTHHINEFQVGVKDILVKPFTIVMGNDDESEIDCVRLTANSNKRGNVTISIYMKTRADEQVNDKAYFTISTDVSSLDRFASNLNAIDQGVVGAKIQLHS